MNEKKRNERKERKENRNERDEITFIRKKILKKKFIKISNDNESEDFKSNDDFNDFDNDDEKFVDLKTKIETNELNMK